VRRPLRSGAGWLVTGLLAGVVAAASALPAAAAGVAPGDPASAAMADSLRQRLEQLQTAGRLEVGGTELKARVALPLLYEEAGYQTFWTSERLQTLVRLVRESEADGLLPQDYHAAELARLAPRLADPALDVASRAELDLLATDGFYLLLYHLYLGKVDPKSLDPKWNFEPRPVKDTTGVAFVLDALTRGRIAEAVAAVRPDHWWYERARAALAEYRALAAKGGWQPVPSGKALKVGSRDPRVLGVRRRLAATGELPADALDSPEFDEALAEAVRRFQARHRIEASGVVGPETLAEMNVPAEARVRQIRVNLERARWVLHEITEADLVVVDVAGFEAAYLRGGEPKWKAKVQVGKPYRQTPIFKSKIDHVVFNPTWTVPPGIIAKDILPQLKKDSGYLGRKGLDLLDRSGRKVDPSGIDWSKQSAGRFPYTVRQEPGPDNALGRVKIIFPNPYFVYLHDTPSKSLFEKEARSFSSGCIRVERSLELAELVLGDGEAWNAESIGKVIEAGEIRTVRLKKPVPVLVMYWTIDPHDPGSTVFKRDPYGRDAPLAAALDAPFRLRAR
jgi:L,D-transpeptidase YcbB